ncbi:MAG: 3-dehydroquinate synthase [Cyanothece sp. SIO1E1]|nr:3-dehydroquinate synthase [Cyanothece sp. SIO1E1]
MIAAIPQIKSDRILNLPSIQQRFSVSFHYPVHFTTKLFQYTNTLLAEVINPKPDVAPNKVMIIVDKGVAQANDSLLHQISEYAQYYSKHFTLIHQPIIVPGGEAAKNDPTLVESIHAMIDQGKLCRHSYVLAIGGGAMLDMAGYAAATAHRGIRLIRIPTTVLAQNDSGVGVKNSINAFGKKNFLGTFAPPFAVLNDFSFLDTLSDRDWRGGIAEAVKVSLIKDADFFHQIEQDAIALNQRDMPAMQQLIYDCSRLHMEHIANHGDPFEMGSSRPLDFGHWVAHRLEYLTNYRLRHGEAVAIGLALDTTYSYLTGLLDQLSWQRILNTLVALGFTLYVPELSSSLTQPSHPRSLFKGLQEFQEHLGGELTIMLLQAIGQGLEVHHVDLERYREAITFLANRYPVVHQQNSWQLPD